MRRTVLVSPQPVLSTPGRGGSARLGNREVEHQGDYRFEEVFKGSYGATAMVDPSGEPKTFDQPFMKEMLELEAAKQHAAEESRKVTLFESGTPERREQTESHVKAEHLVVRRRIALLNRLISEPTNVLCFKGEARPEHLRTAVKYRLLQRNDAGHLFQRQTQQAWHLSSSWEWPAVVAALQTGSEDGDSLVNLVRDVQRSATQDPTTVKALLALHEALDDKQHKLSFTMESNTLVGAHWGAPEINQAKPGRVFVAHGAAVQVSVSAASLDVNYCDEWHNPCINKYVQVHVAESSNASLGALLGGGVASHERKEHIMNTHRVTVVVVKDAMHHVFTLTPFSSSDACTVTHISVHDQDGILALPSDPADISAAPETQYRKHTDVYCCVGSHRSSRLNEQELNYVHAAQLLETHHSLRGHLPDAADLGLDGDSPLAKSARIAFTDWDVLISTFRNSPRDDGDGGMAATLITLVNYPPYGARSHHPAGRSRPPGGGGGRYHNSSRGPPREPQPFVRHKPETTWTRELAPGSMYFIPGLHNPHSVEMRIRQYNIHVIDHSPDRRQTHDFQQEGLRISREIHRLYDTVWQPGRTGGNYAKNIEFNHEIPPGSPPGTLNMGQTYWAMWTHFIHAWVHNAMRPGHAGGFDPPGGCYLYCKDPRIWSVILHGFDPRMVQAWIAFVQGRFHQDKDRLTLKEAPTPLHNNDAAGLGMIALPAGRSSSATAPAVTQLVQQMSKQIQVLQSRVDDKERRETRDCLMQMVLDKLSIQGVTRR